MSRAGFTTLRDWKEVARIDTESARPRCRRKAVSLRELKQLAAARLLERLEQDSLSPADLLKVVQCPEEGAARALPPGIGC